MPQPFGWLDWRPGRRSLPAELRTMLTELAKDFACAGSTLYQLGMVETLLLPELHASLDRTIGFVATDVSAEHLERCRERLDGSTDERRIDLIVADLNRGLALRDASVALMVSASRTVHPFRRVPLIEDVHRGLRTGGCALVVEQVRGRDSLLNNLFATHARERERGAAGGPRLPHSTDHVVMACTLDEECELLQLGGFRSVEVFYRGYGLCGLIAVK